ncbi:MAG: cupin domain-containing protein [Chloroflexota bacterium]|nr:MAG: cupin [Chloroflexota bacterium]
MQIIDFGAERAEPISVYDALRATSVPIGDGSGEAHVYCVRFEPGGSIGEHPAGFGQLFLVVEGAGWVSGQDGRRVEVRAGQGAFFERGELHAKGSEAGMTAIMVQVFDLAPTPPRRA